LKETLVKTCGFLESAYVKGAIAPFTLYFACGCVIHIY